MNRLLESLTELSALEARMDQTSTALAETSARLRALKQRGPLTTPGLQEWVCYAQELEQDFNCCLESLSDFLTRMHWDGPEIPKSKEQWKVWWNTVRSRLIHSKTDKSSDQAHWVF